MTDVSTSEVSVPYPFPKAAKELDILRREIRKARDLEQEQMNIKATERAPAQMAHASAALKEPVPRVDLFKDESLFGDEDPSEDEEAKEMNPQDHQKEKMEEEPLEREGEYEEVLLDDGEELFS